MIAALRSPLTRSSTLALLQFSLALLTLAPTAASAQYKWTGRDGTVTYGDRPPIEEVQARKLGDPLAASDANAALPFNLKSVVEKHPVILYTAPDCTPCEQARNHLSKRGIPFSEKLIKNAADAQAMEKLGFSDSTVPSMTVGRQKQVGFEASALDGLLDIAGYPKTSVVPIGFRNTGPVALAGAAEPTAKGKPPAPGDASKPLSRRERNNQATQTSEAPSTRSPNNPNALRF